MFNLLNLCLNEHIQTIILGCIFNYRNIEYLLRCFKSLGYITHSYTPFSESSVSIAANSISVGVALRQAFPFVTESSHNFYEL